MLDKVSISDLQGDQRDIAEIIGIENYIRLAQQYGGTNIYIAKIDKLKNIKRDVEIYKHFTGKNYKQLANMYSLSERAIREIVLRESTRKTVQLSFFDDS